MNLKGYYPIPTSPYFEMKFWLDKEIEHVEFVKAVVGSLPAGIIAELDEIKAEMETVYHALLSYDLEQPMKKENSQHHPSGGLEIIDTVIKLANCYWKLFLKIAQLVVGNPLAAELVEHIIEETRYFLRVMYCLKKAIN